MENTDLTPKKGRQIVKLAVIVLLLLAIAGVCGYFVYSNIKWNPALIVHISTGINESNGNPTVTNITFEQSRVMYKGKETVPQYPEVNVMVRNETINAAPVGFWAAAPWNPEETSGNYTITVVFREFYTPKTNDTLIVTIRHVAIRGYIMNKQTAFYEWR